MREKRDIVGGCYNFQWRRKRETNRILEPKEDPNLREVYEEWNE